MALACIGVRLWAERCRPWQPDGSAVPNRALAVRRGAAEVAALAAGLVRSTPGEHDSSASWLGTALAVGMPAGVAVIDDSDGDAVLHAEALSTLRAAWVSRGALELLVIHALDREPTAPPRGPAAAYRIAAARAAAQARRLHAARIDAAWRKHSLALARTLATYMRARIANQRWPGDAREELIDVLADSLAQISRLDVLLGRKPDGGCCALGT